MLICPECHFENPDTNKYCQSCGTSLTHAACYECGNSIVLGTEKCDYCGADTRIVLWGFVSQKQEPESVIINSETELSLADTITISITDLSNKLKGDINTPDINEQYLDQEKRYRLDSNSSQNLIKSTGVNLSSTLTKVKVFDCQPLQKKYFKSFQDRQTELFAELEQDLETSYFLGQKYWEAFGIPIHALPYLKLKKFTPAIPEIYDAWHQENRSVVLLSDRSKWQLLTQVWAEKDLPLVQILWSLDEMAKLWTPLSEIGCNKSLLIEDNLRVDEDQSFCLQQIYRNEPEIEPSLDNLAQNWQQWLIDSGKDDYELLIQVLNHVIDGVIETIDELRQKLQDIAEEESLQEDDIEIEHTEVIYLGAPSTTEDYFEQDYFLEEDEEDGSIVESGNEEQPTLMIPMQLASVTDAGCTDIGRQRDHNEDFFWMETKTHKQENGLEKHINVRGLYVVCDGMGGHAAGEIASAMAVEMLQKYFQTHWQNELPDQETITNGIFYANQALYQNNVQNERAGSGRMGTTLVMALVQDNQVAIAHVGDSRIYQVTRQQGLQQLTLDHEVGQREINRGVEPEIAYGRPDAYQLTQALGPRESKYIRPDIQYLDIQEDTLLLLCSDGLCDNRLVENNWETYLSPLISSSANLEEGLFQLIELANKYNGHDNITGILVRIKLRPNF